MTESINIFEVMYFSIRNKKKRVLTGQYGIKQRVITIRHRIKQGILTGIISKLDLEYLSKL
jgi:hypothetical protein